MNEKTREDAPICIDLYAGTGGWTRGFLAEGYRCFGFDIERHTYTKDCPECDGTGNFYRHDEDGDFLDCGECDEGRVTVTYPGQLILQDARTLHGSQFRNASVIVASPPCQEFTRHQLPWTKRRNPPPPDLSLIEAAFRIAIEAGRPLVLENVREAQRYIGPAKAHYGSRYLWGDVPPILPFAEKSRKERMSSSAVAQRSEIPFDLAQFIARVFRPEAAR